ncbi:Lactate racemase [Moorella humiferrea]|uniref:nickel-dependent lactate racemase n=1 Tax=Neomoorella humiferrea TaxID=676965 RepID=UPI0030CC938B
MARKFRLPYGRGQYQEITIAEKNYLGTLTHHEVSLQPGQNDLAAALARPVASPPLREIVKPGEKIALVTSDITRPCPSHQLLPPVLKELELAGVKDQDITIILATGNHRQHTEAEKQRLVGEEIYARYRCLDADAKDAVYLGETRRGTPVEIFRPVVEADRRILLGNVEYHYFAGYSGGVKAIMPGCSTPRAIQANHRMMVEPGARAGEIENNPVRQDIEEVLNFLSVDFIVNVVLDEHKDVLAAFAGHPIAAHRQAARYLDGIYKVNIAEPADIVIASAGGFPKDINLYQAQKAIDNARRAVRPGGILILVAACPEGLGDATFAAWVAAAQKPGDLIERVHTNFELGGHKAAAIAMVLQDIRIYLVSSLPVQVARQIFLEPFSSLTEAYNAALRELGADAKVLLIPQAGAVLPILCL